MHICLHSMIVQPILAIQSKDYLSGEQDKKRTILGNMLIKKVSQLQNGVGELRKEEENND